MVRDENHRCIVEEKRDEACSIEQSKEPESRLTPEVVDKKNNVTKKPTKSVTLIDNVDSNTDLVVRRKREEDSKKRKDNKCLRGILKSKTDTNAPVPSDVDRVVAAPYDIPKTEDPYPNPCPRYFGIKSYIDSFYYPPDSELLNSGEYVQDDFEFVVEPGKRRWKNLWCKVGLWSGINFLLLGIIALLVGHLTPPRETIVARVDNLEILDRSAITFNSRLHLCRLSGITIFCIGGIVLMLTMLVSSYQQQDIASYYVVNTTGFLPEDSFARWQGSSYSQRTWASRIPLSGIVKPVQPR